MDVNKRAAERLTAAIKAQIESIDDIVRDVLGEALDGVDEEILEEIDPGEFADTVVLLVTAEVKDNLRDTFAEWMSDFQGDL